MPTPPAGSNAMADIKIVFKYALFKRTLWSLDPLISAYARVSSGRTVKAILTTACCEMSEYSGAPASEFPEVRVYMV